MQYIYFASLENALMKITVAKDFSEYIFPYKL